MFFSKLPKHDAAKLSAQTFSKHTSGVTAMSNRVLYYFFYIFTGLKIVSEYDQEIPHLQTADKPVASRGRATQQSQDTRKTSKAKQPALFPIEMIAKLEWTQSNVQQNIERLQNPSNPVRFRTLTICNVFRAIMADNVNMPGVAAPKEDNIKSLYVLF